MPSGIRKVQFELTQQEWGGIQALAMRLEISPIDLTRRLAVGGMQALEAEKHILWPIYLVQAGTKAVLE